VTVAAKSSPGVRREDIVKAQSSYTSKFPGPALEKAARKGAGGTSEAAE
jgi:hypothetical protein